MVCFQWRRKCNAESPIISYNATTERFTDKANVYHFNRGVCRAGSCYFGVSSL